MTNLYCVALDTVRVVLGSPVESYGITHDLSGSIPDKQMCAKRLRLAPKIIHECIVPSPLARRMEVRPPQCRLSFLTMFDKTLSRHLDQKIEQPSRLPSRYRI